MRKTLTTVAFVVGALSLGGIASANPVLTIVNTSVGTEEHTGDPGGTAFPFVNEAGTNGPGVPWQSRNDAGGITGGWPTGPGMSADTSFPPNYGTSGWSGAYLTLNKTATVTFQYMGKGDSTLANSFEVFTGGLWVELFNSTTDACGAAGAAPVVPTCTAGINQFAYSFDAGYVPFRYITGNDVTLTNDGQNNPANGAESPGYFLGVDPYLAGGVHQTSGTAVYAGLTDLASTGDHDYQDFGVRISVPEPGSLSLALLGLAGLALVSRRRRAKV